MAAMPDALVTIKANGKTVLERAIAAITVRGKGEGWGGIFEAHALPAGLDLTTIDGLEMAIEGGGKAAITVLKHTVKKATFEGQGKPPRGL